MLTTNFASEDHPKDSIRRDAVSGLHLVACVFSMLIIIYYMLMCIASFFGALDDMRKFGGLGFSYPIQHYLNINSFGKSIARFLAVIGEFLLYIILYRRIKKVKLHWIGMWCMAAMLLLHTAMCIYAIALDMPKSPPYIAENGVGRDFCVFAYLTGIQAIVYFILYLSRVQKNGYRKDP